MTTPPLLHDDAASSRAGRSGLPDALLPYQQRWIADKAPLKACEKSRRIGFTWGEAADAALTAAARPAAGGMDAFYMGYNLEMAREFIGDCADWLRAYHQAASEIGETVFEDVGSDGSTREIRALRIDLPSGHKIVALSSAPRSLRGMQGLVILDEAAFHTDLAEVLKAALALLIWGGRVHVISTHDGADNPFNELIQDIRAGRRPGSVHRVTFDEAVADGLYRRVCLRAGRAWTAEDEAQWRAEVIAFYGDGADEELHVIPRAGAGRWLSRALVEARMRDDVPVLRWRPPAGFVHWTDAQRRAETLAWCEAHLAALLAQLPRVSHALGVDFGRVIDLSVFWPISRHHAARLETPFVVELRDVPFTDQELILLFICDRLHRLSAIALDARGNGAYLAERAMQRYGAGRVKQVQLSEPWYREHMPRVRAAIEDGAWTLPKDGQVLDDFLALHLVRGVARVPDKRTGGKGQERHGDAAIAGALALYAAEMEVRDYAYESVAVPQSGMDGARAVQDDDEGFGQARQAARGAGLGAMRGAW